MCIRDSVEGIPHLAETSQRGRGEATLHLYHKFPARAGRAPLRQETRKLERLLRSQAEVEYAHQRLIDRRRDPRVPRRTHGEHWPPRAARALKHDRGRKRAPVPRVRESRSVLRRVGAVRRKLVVVDEPEAGRDVEVPAPGTERLCYGDDVAVT